jgi:hypothetical protein
MISARIAALAAATALALTACSSSNAAAYSFDTAIDTAAAGTLFHVDITVRSNDDEVSTIACDIDRDAGTMGCVGTSDDESIESADEPIEMVTDFANATTYINLDAMRGEFDLPDSARWVAVDNEQMPQFVRGDTVLYDDPLATIATLADVNAVAGDIIDRDGESLRTYRVELDPVDALAFTQRGAGTDTSDTATGFTFYVTAANTLRGFTYTYTSDDGDEFVEVWIDDTGAFAVELPLADTVISFDALMDLIAGAGGQVSADMAVLHTAEAVARQANAAGAMAVDGSGVRADDIIAALDELVVGDQWTITSPEQIRAIGCVNITFTEPGVSSTANIRLADVDGVRTATAAPGACLL